ncbi:MAG: FMN-binding glutamate synthase family protein [Gemmatimonadetes bacterium]|nr:FMN-binding glutamate synthase family protein [Gemmatimonadota bacterium]
MTQALRANDAIGAANRGNPTEAGLCTSCRSDCQGKCETWLSSMMGRKMLYPRDFGDITTGSGSTTHVGVSYSSLRIQGYNYGACGLPPGLSDSADDCVFPNVSLETSFGATQQTKARLPIMTGALGSTAIARKYWDSLAVGAALVGFPIVVGENVVGIDRKAEFADGHIVVAPELDHRIDSYLRYASDYGAIMVQLNVEDARNGVAEYVVEKYGDRVIIELKWGQGAKDIGGEIQVTDLNYAIFLKERGYIVDPDPTLPDVQEAFKKHAITSFARHSRLGYTDLADTAAVEAAFMDAIEHLRQLGCQRISLKTGAYGMEALAMAIRYASKADLDLLTIDGSGGGPGMSPWNMMETWGVPSLLLHAKAHEYASLLAARGERVVDMAFAGGLAREDHLFKALALGSPFTKLICMGRSLMIPAFLGSNIQGVFQPENRADLSAHWEKLPTSVAKVGTYPEEIFAGYHEVQAKVGVDEMANIPFGAVAIWTLADKLGAGLQQFMAGARRFDVGSICREDIVSANRETEKETGIGFITDALDQEARDIQRWSPEFGQCVKLDSALNWKDLES